jgi:hypothetical protein
MPGAGIGLFQVASRGGVAAFSPLSLFASGEQGGWYDPSDLSTMFQLSTGTTAVAVNDPVGYIADKSGRGNHLTQANTASRPVLRQDAGGKYYLEFDGVDDKLLNATLDIAAQPITLAAVGRIQNAGSSRGNYFDGSNTSPASASAQRCILGSQTSTNYRVFAGLEVNSAASSRDTENHVLIGVANGVTAALYEDGVSIATGNAGTQVFDGLTVGGEYRSTNLTQQLNGHFYGGVVVGSLADVSLLTEWLAEKAGVTLP